MADEERLLVLTDDERDAAVRAMVRRIGMTTADAREAVACVQLAVHDEDPRIVAVEALHYPDVVPTDEDNYCHEDGTPWPCDTARALHPDRQTWETPS